MSRWDLLSPELKVSVGIFRLKEQGRVPYFSSLKDELKMDSETLHGALDRLIDIGAIDANWEKTDGKWVREFYLKNPNEEFIRKLDENLEDEC